MSRPSKDEYFIDMAKLVASRGTCVRRQVGCVLVDRRGVVLATGYNGPPSGWPHCVDKPCPGAEAPPGQGLDACQAIHAEMNALTFCSDISKIHVCYVTNSPCLICVRLLINTSCRRVVFAEPYAHDDAARDWWRYTPDRDGPVVRSKRTWEHFSL